MNIIELNNDEKFIVSGGINLSLKYGLITFAGGLSVVTGIEMLWGFKNKLECLAACSIPVTASILVTIFATAKSYWQALRGPVSVILALSALDKLIRLAVGG